MRARLLLVAVCACGEPEQLLDVSSKLQSLGGEGPQTVTLLRGDRGADADTGCGTFSQLRAQKAPLDDTFDFQVLREEATAPTGQRCFRLDWESSAGAHSSVIFSPFDHDVALPPLAVWPDLDPGRLRPSSVFSCGPSCNSFEFYTPPTGLVATRPDFAFLAPQFYVEAFDNSGVLWRDTYLLVAQTQGFTGIFEAEWTEGRTGVFLRSGVVTTGVRYTRDRVGRLVTLYVEYRVTGPTWPVTATSSLQLVSRGASCEGFDPCPFTDGDFEPVSVDDFRPVIIDLGAEYEASSVLVRGLWLGDPQAMTIGLEGSVQPGVTYPLDVAELGSTSVVLARDGLSGLPRLDVRFLNVGRVRYLRIVPKDRLGINLPIKRLAELSVFQ